MCHRMIAPPRLKAIAAASRGCPARQNSAPATSVSGVSTHELPSHVTTLAMSTTVVVRQSATLRIAFMSALSPIRIHSSPSPQPTSTNTTSPATS